MEHLELTAILKPQTLRSKGPLEIMQAKESLKLNDSSLLDSGQQGADSALAENVINAIAPVIDQEHIAEWEAKTEAPGKAEGTKQECKLLINYLFLCIYMPTTFIPQS